MLRWLLANQGTKARAVAVVRADERAAQPAACGRAPALAVGCHIGSWASLVEAGGASLAGVERGGPAGWLAATERRSCGMFVGEVKPLAPGLKGIRRSGPLAA